MQDYNTIIGSIQMRLNGCTTRSVMDRYQIGSGTLSLIMERYHAGGKFLKQNRNIYLLPVKNGILMGNKNTPRYISLQAQFEQ